MALTEESFRSNEEIYFWWWLEDVVKHGIILSYQYEPEALILVPEATILQEKMSKTKAPKPFLTTLKITQQQTYTYDFKVIWNPAYQDVLFTRIDRILKMTTCFFYAKETEEGLASFVDVKGGFSPASSSSDIRFTLKQAMTYRLYKIYVQKVIVVASYKHKLERRYRGLFVETFIPERYLFTDKSGLNRKINFQFKTTQEWLSTLKK